MNNKDKNSLSYKIQKNPFILGLFIIVLILVLIVVFSLSSAIKKKTDELKATTEAPTTEAVARVEETTENIFKVENIKKRADGIKKVTCGFENNCATVTVEFNDKESLMEAHYASNDYSYDVYPEFCFYVSGGAEIKCPGELKVLSDTSVCYYLYEIGDLTNAAALTNKITINYQNALASLKFNVYIRHKTNDGVGRTIVGTYGKTSEDFNSAYGQAPLILSSKATGVESVEAVKTEEFIWLDIYFENDKQYNKLNHNFENNFLCFGFEKGGRKYDWKFITTEYSELNMIRCKLDSYALEQLNAEVEGDELSIKELFDFTINVWSSDYDKDIQLVTIN